MSNTLIGLEFDRAYTQADLDAGRGFKDGERASDKDGNEFVFCQMAGASGASANDVMVIQNNAQTSRISASIVTLGERVGICQVALADNEWGWIKVYGSATIAVSSSTALGAALYAYTTTGELDDAGSLGQKRVLGIGTYSAESGGEASAFLTHPTVDVTV